MDYAAASDAVVAAAWAIGVFAAQATLTFVAGLFLLRWHASARRRRVEARTVRWRQQLLDAMHGDATLGPADVRRRDRELVLDVWCGLQATLRGDSRPALNRVLSATGLDAVCRRWLAMPRPVDRRRLGVVALGYLGAREDWSRLLPLLDASPSWLATAAMQGLMRIDPTSAASRVLDRLHGHEEWSRDALRAAFREAGPAAVTPALLAWLAAASPAALAHGLPLVATGERSAMQAALVPLLRTDLPPEALLAVVAHVDDPRALPALRALADHAAWEVRTQVATALGRIGTRDDGDVLCALLGDRWWWVRYRAAQALVALPGHGQAELEALLARLDDRYARDAMRHAAAERWLTLPESTA